MNSRAFVAAILCLTGTSYLAGCAQSGSPGSAQAGSEPRPATAPAASAPAPATPAPAPVTPAPSASKAIFIGSQMRYAPGAIIDTAVLTECQLPQQGAELLETAARGAGLNLLRNDQAVNSGTGRSFQVEIVNVVSSGNAFIGHRKQVAVRGRLLEDGKELAAFQGTRTSMGGAFAGFKGSCSVLGRCLEALAGDMTVWLRGQGLR
jgi:hypothetical protein